MVAAGRFHDIVQLARLHETKLRFLFAGGLNTLFGLSIFPILMWTFASRSIHYLVILTFAQIISVCFAFLNTKFIVFRTQGRYVSEFLKFSTFYLGNFLANLLVLPLMVEVCGMSPIWGQFAFSSCVIVSSYLWHSRVTFRTGVRKE